MRDLTRMFTDDMKRGAVLYGGEWYDPIVVIELRRR
jgi:hypothetical protein